MIFQTPPTHAFAALSPADRFAAMFDAAECVAHYNPIAPSWVATLCENVTRALQGPAWQQDVAIPPGAAAVPLLHGFLLSVSDPLNPWKADPDALAKFMVDLILKTDKATSQATTTGRRNNVTKRLADWLHERPATLFAWRNGLQRFASIPPVQHLQSQASPRERPPGAVALVAMAARQQRLGNWAIGVAAAGGFSTTALAGQINTLNDILNDPAKMTSGTASIIGLGAATLLATAFWAKCRWAANVAKRQRLELVIMRAEDRHRVDTARYYDHQHSTAVQ